MTKKILSLSMLMCLFVFSSCNESDTLTNFPVTQGKTGSNNNFEEILIFIPKGGDVLSSGDYSEFFEMLLNGSIKSIEYTRKRDTNHSEFRDLVSYFSEHDADPSYLRCIAENTFHSFEFNEEMSVNGEIWFDYYTSARSVWRDWRYGQIVRNDMDWRKYRFVRGDNNTVIGYCYHLPFHPTGSNPAEEQPEVKWTPWLAEKWAFKDGNLFWQESYYNVWKAPTGVFEVEFSDELGWFWKKTSENSFVMHSDFEHYPKHRMTDIKITRK